MWLASETNVESEFLSRHCQLIGDFKIISSEIWRVCQTMQLWPTLCVFASKWYHQVPWYMTWDWDICAVAVNALDYYWDPITWLFPPVPLIPLALKGVQQHQVDVILISLE